MRRKDEPKAMSHELEAHHKKIAEADANNGVYSSKSRRLPDGVACVDEDRIPLELRAVLSRPEDRNNWPFYFIGDVGRGKSCTAAAFYLKWPPPVT